MPEAKGLYDLLRIRAHNRDLLNSINSGLGTALGLKKPTGGDIEDKPAVIVFVPLKINPKWIPESQILPKKLEGPDGLWCHLDVVQGGRGDQDVPFPEYSGELIERIRGWNEYVCCGSVISYNNDASNPRSYIMGTLGAFVRSKIDGKVGVLTNQHVAGSEGQKLYHPVPWGTHIATSTRVLEYVQDEDWYGRFYDEPKAYVRVDAAFAELDSGFDMSNIDYSLIGVGKLGPVKEVSLNDMSIIGQEVLHVGATTGLQYGTVAAFGYEYEQDDTGQKYYCDLLIAGGDDNLFSYFGDSGGLVVTNDTQRNPIAQLWGGERAQIRSGKGQENWTNATLLTRLLDSLNIELIL